jgi:hypothetical protein
MFMTTAGFVILILLALLGLWLFVEIGSLPGKTAKKRSHPQAEAINVLGWLGLLFGGVGWAVALVWAYTKPVFVPVAQEAAPTGSREPGDSEESS